MLAKSQRLNLKTDFKWVAGGKKIDSEFLKMFIRMGENEKPKVGVAISSKNFRKATERNRTKRVVFQAFQSLYSSLPNNINIVALPKQMATSVKSGDLLLDLEAVLKDEKIIN